MTKSFEIKGLFKVGSVWSDGIAVSYSKTTM